MFWALDWIRRLRHFVRITGGRLLEGRRYIASKEAKALCEGNWYLDSEVGENMLALRLIGFRQPKVWIEDATAWARSEVKDLDDISKLCSIDELMILLCYYLRLMTRKGLFVI